jgi:hypothetical protein
MIPFLSNINILNTLNIKYSKNIDKTKQKYLFVFLIYFFLKRGFLIKIYKIIILRQEYKINKIKKEILRRYTLG